MKKLHILVVEDGRSQREMLRDFLIKEGHTVAEAENGERAVQSVLKGHFDLVLLDLRLPGGRTCLIRSVCCTPKTIRAPPRRGSRPMKIHPLPDLATR